MRGLRGMFAGVLALVALEAVLSSRQAANRVGGLLTDVGAIATRLLDPKVAAVPDFAGAYSRSPTAAPALYSPPEPAPPANNKPKPRKPVVAPPPPTYNT